MTCTRYTSHSLWLQSSFFTNFLASAFLFRDVHQIPAGLRANFQYFFLIFGPASINPMFSFFIVFSLTNWCLQGPLEVSIYKVPYLTTFHFPIFHSLYPLVTRKHSMQLSSHIWGKSFDIKLGVIFYKDLLSKPWKWLSLCIRQNEIW